MITKTNAILMLMLFYVFCTSCFANVKDSVVKIFVTSTPPSYYTPWENQGIEQASGSGVVISEKRILTNAHVVADASYIEVLLFGEAKRYEAKVMAVSHEADLALLEVLDNEFFDGISAVSIGDLPKLQDQVHVYGFPEGGEGLSVTKGVVSRIELRTYSHSQMDLLSMQIDAAINSGNSGGPVVKDGKVVGIAMQTLNKAENIGHVIPTPVINHFLEDVADGQYDGFPVDGTFFQKMNDTLLSYVGLEDDTGVYINEIILGSPSDGILERGDVILEVDGRDIANDGSTLLREGLRVDQDYLIQMKQLGETIEFLVWRNGAKQKTLIPLNMKWGDHFLVKRPQYDQRPQFFIYGGLVFTPLTFNLLEAWGDEWYNDAPANYLNYYYYKEKEKAGEEVVVLDQVLNSKTVSEYSDFTSQRVVSVNGKKFKTFEEFFNLTSSVTTQFVNFGLENSAVVIIPREYHEQENENILRLYNIPMDKNIN